MADDEKHQGHDVQTEKAFSSLPIGETIDIETLYGVNEKKLLRKLDIQLLPALTFLYLLSFLDRSNGGFD